MFHYSFQVVMISMLYYACIPRSLIPYLILIPLCSPSSSPTPPPPTSFTNYTIMNTSLLPKNVSAALRALDHDYQDGDITEKGYMKKRAVLLEPFKNLVSVNGTVSFGVQRDQVDSKEDSRHGNGLVGGVRKLLLFEGGGQDEEEHHLAEVVAIAKRKELNRDKDLRKALEEWEMKYGEWVSVE